jgi:hypothetical protein
MRQGGQRCQQHNEKRKQDGVSFVPHFLRTSLPETRMIKILIIGLVGVKKNSSRTARPHEKKMNGIR